VRLDAIERSKQRIRNERETVSMDIRGIEDLKHFRLGVDRSLHRRVADLVGPTLFAMRERKQRALAAIEFPFRADRVSVGYRYARAAFQRVQNRLKPIKDIKSVLVQGCWLGDGEVQHWLARGVPSVSGVEIVNMVECWKSTVPELEREYGIKPDFRHGTVENLPFETHSIDLVASAAVYEHVYDLDRAMAEVARVLRPGGLTSHEIGPLYYSYGGDHCSTNYDHLMLGDGEYKRFLGDNDHFAKLPDPNCRNWALLDKFSFATAAEYLNCIQRHLNVECVLAIICPEAIRFREESPKDWATLIAAGIPACDLLTVGLCVHARKA
jgi:SAM-dependent methyltransferase